MLLRSILAVNGLLFALSLSLPYWLVLGEILPTENRYCRTFRCTLLLFYGNKIDF